MLQKKRPGSQWQTQWFRALQHSRCMHMLRPEEPLSLKVSVAPSCFTLQQQLLIHVRWEGFGVGSVPLPASASRHVRPGRSQVTKKLDFSGTLAGILLHKK